MGVFKTRGYAMRKLLLNSTALAAAATLAATAAMADVSISGSTEFAYSSRTSDIAASDGTFNSTDSEIAFKFTNKTDNGLTIGYTMELDGDASTATPVDESSISISGGFGTIVLGNNDGVGDNYGMASDDIIAEESSAGAPDSATIRTDSDIALGINDNAKVIYHMPAMGGLTAGVSFEDSGTSAAANTATDTTSIGARYTTELSGMTILVGGAAAEQETAVGTASTATNNMGVKITRGPITVAFASARTKSDDEDISASGAAISYAMGDGVTVGAYTDSSEDDLDAGEKFSINGVELQYVVAPGLTAVLNHDSYDYTAGTSDEATSDKGSLTKLTIKAAF